jgi:hypothetical protein
MSPPDLARDPPRRFFVRVGALAGKEAIHIRRDIRTLYRALGMPVVMLLLFGFGVSFDVDQSRWRWWTTTTARSPGRSPAASSPRTRSPASARR